MNKKSKNILVIFLCLLIIMLLCGCSTLVKPLHSAKAQYTDSKMYTAATQLNLHTNNARLLKVLEKASRQEPVTVGFFGGSITEGYVTSEPSLIYARRVLSYFEKAFPSTDFTFVNAGIAGTGSGIGVHRLEVDLLSQKPDLVIVDAAVNDHNNEHYQQTYENLVRQILLSDSEPAVILLFMVEENGTCATELESQIGDSYQLPMIDYGAAVNLAMAAGDFSWEDIAVDYVHPNDKGHAIIAELINSYINNVYNEYCNFWGDIPSEAIASIEDIDYSSHPFVTKENYQKGQLLSLRDVSPDSYGAFEPYNSNSAFPDGLQLKSGTDSLPDNNLSFKVTGANIGLLLESSDVDKAGYFDVYVDDAPVSVCTYQGFLMCDVDIFSSDTVNTHTITIKRNPEYPDCDITILAVLVSE